MEWVKSLTRQPVAQGVTILDRIRELAASGIHRGAFQAIASADTPEDSTGWGYNIFFYTAEKIVVFAVQSYYPKLWFRQIDSNGWADAWTPLTTATPPVVYDLPLAAGFAPSTKSYYKKDQFGQEHVHGAISAGSGTITWGIALCTLPVGYRPGEAQEYQATFCAADGTCYGGAVAVGTDGVIKAYAQNGSTTKITYFDCWFNAA